MQQRIDDAGDKLARELALARAIRANSFSNDNQRRELARYIEVTAWIAYERASLDQYFANVVWC